MILISGATGTSGKSIVLQLAALGVQVKALVRDIEKARDFRGKCVHVVEGDFERPETLAEALRGVDRALLLPANSERQPAQERAFIDAAKRAGVRHVVKFSAHSTEHRESGARLVRWHAEAEEYLERSGLAWTHLRPSFFMQNFLGQAASIAGEGVFYTALGEVQTTPIDVRDIAAVAVKTLTEHGHEGRAYTLTGPETLTQDEVAERFSTALGRPVRHVLIPSGEWKANLAAAGVPTWMGDALVELNEFVSKPHGVEKSNAVRNILGRAPIAFEQFVRDHAAAFGVAA